MKSFSPFFVNFYIYAKKKRMSFCPFSRMLFEPNLKELSIRPRDKEFLISLKDNHPWLSYKYRCFYLSSYFLPTLLLTAENAAPPPKLEIIQEVFYWGTITSCHYFSIFNKNNETLTWCHVAKHESFSKVGEPNDSANPSSNGLNEANANFHCYTRLQHQQSWMVSPMPAK